jgi:hypothetical protein
VCTRVVRWLSPRARRRGDRQARGLDSITRPEGLVCEGLSLSREMIPQ